MKTNVTIGTLLLGLLLTVQALAETSPEAALDAFHDAGTDGKQTEIIALLAEDAVFLGVDGGDRLEGPALREFVRTSLASGKSWAYRSSDREIRLSADGLVAWFDESLQHEQLGRGRASGVLVQNGGNWKIAQYNLTVPLPDGALVSPAGASGAAAGTTVTEVPQKPQCTQLRHKTLKKSRC